MVSAHRSKGLRVGFALAICVGNLLGSPEKSVAATNPLAQSSKSLTQGKAVAKPHSKSKSSSKKTPHRPIKGHHSDATFPADVENTPGFVYAQMTRDACYREVENRHLSATPIATSYLGLDAPMRLSGKLNDVEFRTNFVESDGSPSVYSLIDCRLVLALDDYSKILRDLGIVEVKFSSSYRPPPKDTREGTQGRRHAGGLAIDVHDFKSANFGWLSVEKDFHGRLGTKVCGSLAKPPVPVTKNAQLLRNLVCSAANAHLFQSILTPNYDRPHRNHIHFEVTQGVRWFLVS